MLERSWTTKSCWDCECCGWMRLYPKEWCWISWTNATLNICFCSTIVMSSMNAHPTSCCTFSIVDICINSLCKESMIMHPSFGIVLHWPCGCELWNVCTQFCSSCTLHQADLYEVKSTKAIWFTTSSTMRWFLLGM